MLRLDLAHEGHGQVEKRLDGFEPLPRCVCWVFITGGCSGRGVQWMGAELCNKLVYNIISITTPCFHYTPLCGM